MIQGVLIVCGLYCVFDYIRKGIYFVGLSDDHFFIFLFILVVAPNPGLTIDPLLTKTKLKNRIKDERTGSRR